MLFRPPEKRSNDVLAQFLKLLLEQMPIVRRLAKLIRSQELWSLDALANELWSNSAPASQDATVLLLRLAASARSSNELSPLIPHRLHCLVRAPEGLSVCLNSECSAPDDARQDKVGAFRRHKTDAHFVTQSHCRCSVARPAVCGRWAGTRILKPAKWSPAFLPKFPSADITSSLQLKVWSLAQ